MLRARLFASGLLSRDVRAVRASLAAAVGIASLLLATCTHVKPVVQNPSPMVETTRLHGRVTRRTPAGRVVTIRDVLPKPVEVLVTPAAEGAPKADLVVHFHGASFVAMQAAEELRVPIVVAVVNLGAGSGAYGAAFQDAGASARLFAAIEQATGSKIDRRYLVGFSAGYGAIRAILRNQYASVDGVLLLDGLHTSYVPEGKPLAAGGVLDEKGLDAFRRLAVDAASARKRFFVTHSEIFPGTFASTTETTDYLLRAIGLKRNPVVVWGPLGMQQLSEARAGSFALFGFAGNTGPDHVDHLHALGHFLPMLVEPSSHHAGEREDRPATSRLGD